MTTKSQSAKQQQNEAIERLHEWLKPGDTIYTILRHVSRSGMQREISLKFFGERSEPYDLNYSVAQAGDYRIGKHDGIVVGGCGMDMGFHLVYNLGQVLYPDGYGCVGEKCRSNDHSNGDSDRTPGYPKGARLVEYVDRTDPEPRTVRRVVGFWGDRNTEGHRTLSVHDGPDVYLFDDEIMCDAPAPAHWHTDGGYAFNQKWL